MKKTKSIVRFLRLCCVNYGLNLNEFLDAQETAVVIAIVCIPPAAAKLIIVRICRVASHLKISNASSAFRLPSVLVPRFHLRVCQLQFRR